MNSEFDIFTFHNLVNIGVIITVVILVTRWVFMVPRMMKRMETQTQLLKELAESAGVNEVKIKEIMSKLD